MKMLLRYRHQPWFWSATASLFLLALAFALSEEFKPGLVTANLAAASFLALVGIGQMFPIATGEGGIDLSIPFVMNFCAFLAVKMISDDPFTVVMVWPAAIAFGLLVGAVNGAVVVAFRIPPIIGTLAVGFVVLTLVQIISLGGATTIANRDVTLFVRGSMLGIPTPFYFVLLVGLLATIFVNRTAVGQELLAVGQSRRAARLAGISVNRRLVTAYLISGSLAGFTGALLACSVGSADMELGNPFLLTSVGAVILGGNRLAGGVASVPGTICGAILLTLLVLAVTVAGFPIEMKNIAIGLVITVVLVAANPHDTGRPGLRFPGRKPKESSS